MPSRRARGRRWLAVLVGVLVLGAALWSLTGADVPTFAAVRAAYRPSEAYLLDRQGELLDAQRVDRSVRRLGWSGLDAISPALVEAVVQGEDRRFWSHHGVDWLGVVAAVRDQLQRGRRRGASTITMQLASLLQRPGRPAGGARDLADKGRQVRYALSLERHWTKPEILEAYLNLVSFRGDLQGVTSVAQILAQKAPSGLSLGEAAVLAALLPSPEAGPEAVAARACARQARVTQAVPCPEIRDVAQAMLSHGRTFGPEVHLAPQLAHHLLRAPGQAVQTTLDAHIQAVAIEALAKQLGSLRSHNVRDGAALVVDNVSGDVLAYVGSGGIYSGAPELDGVRSPRQAGSTLKPFLYELALERRYLTAASLLDDAPLGIDTSAGLYLPQDYDHDYKGLVTVRTALASSLNVPAVRTAMLVGVEPLRDRLQAVGYAGISMEAGYYGYALALGSAEVTLWEQATAYRALARGGRAGSIHVTAAASQADSRPVLDADATFVIGDVLSDRGARVATFGLDNALATRYWSAVKTGTSKDMRDNWCVGFTPRHTVAVWVGNFEGDSMQDVSGVTGAAPVWREIMDALQGDGSASPPAPPVGVHAQDTHFAGGIESARREWFLSGTAAGREVEGIGAHQRLTRISSPIDGTIIALDPDIPASRQRVAITVEGGADAYQLRLDDAPLGRATSALLWTPVSGHHRITLEDRAGQPIDRVAFLVR